MGDNPAMQTNSTEIEFKLSCMPASATVLARYLSRLTGAAPQRLQLRNAYYDTPDQALRARGIALRIRHQRSGRKNAVLQTVKCAGQVSGGLSSRPEWETPYGGRFDFASVDHPVVRQTLETLQAKPGYQAMLDTDFERRVWHWRPEGGTHIEIALDQGQITAGGRHERICELELELLSGPPTRLFDLAAHLADIAPLFPAPLSKATRGSLLLANKPPALPKQDQPMQTCAEAVEVLLQDCLDHIALRLPANHGNFNAADDLPRIRTELQRLYQLLQQIRPLLRKSWPRRAITQGAREHLQVLTTRNAREYLSSTTFAYWLLHSSLALHVQPVRRKLRTQAWSAIQDKVKHA